ncbi:MAG: hypothetical protein EXR93_06115 [Gemmatimonadetes bacterium]|nr:hypothetical protein [Gemmatimonadota bacterium]
MLRTLVGYAALAVIGFFLLNVAFGLLGLVLSIAIKLAIWAAIGFGIYLLLKVISPDTARRVQEMVSGKPAPPPAA